jgi:hypothetical protein
MTDINLRNIATIERLAKEVLEQCAHYRRNAKDGDDTLRFLVLYVDAEKLVTVTRRATERVLSKAVAS